MKMTIERFLYTNVTLSGVEVCIGFVSYDCVSTPLNMTPRLNKI